MSIIYGTAEHKRRFESFYFGRNFIGDRDFSNITPEEIFIQHQLAFYATLFLKFIPINPSSRKCHVYFSFEIKLKLDNVSYKSC